MKSQVLHTVWCHISCEAAGEFWHWSLSGVKGLNLCHAQHMLCYCSPHHPIVSRPFDEYSEHAIFDGTKWKTAGGIHTNPIRCDSRGTLPLGTPPRERIRPTEDVANNSGARRALFPKWRGLGSEELLGKGLLLSLPTRKEQRNLAEACYLLSSCTMLREAKQDDNCQTRYQFSIKCLPKTISSYFSCNFKFHWV